MRGDAPDDPAAPAGEEQLHIGVFEERVLARCDKFDRFHAQRRHPRRVACVDAIGQVHKGNAIGLAGNGRDDYFAIAAGGSGHDLAFVWN